MRQIRIKSRIPFLICVVIPSATPSSALVAEPVKAYFCSTTQYGDYQHFVGAFPANGEQADVINLWEKGLRSQTSASLITDCRTHPSLASAKSQLNSYQNTYASRGQPIAIIDFTLASLKISKKTVSNRLATPPSVTSPPLPATLPKGPTPNQLKYHRELAEYQARLADIEQIKAATAAKLASDKVAAQRILDQHRQELEVNRRQIAEAVRAKRAYELELAAHEDRAKQMRTKQDRDALTDWLEAVTVCELNAQNPQAKFGNWRCEGPLQMDYAKLGNGSSVEPKALFNVSNACGGKVESVRDLGLVGGYRVFGCSYGMHPNQAQRLSRDAAAKFGLGYIPGRITYRCPKWQSSCRVR